MNTKIALFFFTLISILYFTNTSVFVPQEKEKNKQKAKTVLASNNDTIKSSIITQIEQNDTIAIFENLKFKPYKKNAHASYYHDKFNGLKTASGTVFSNSKYTAAHKKLPFGTKVKVTNEKNGRFVIVEITDRGPFSKTREIDLTRKAFMELVDNKGSGSVIVTIEVEVK